MRGDVRLHGVAMAGVPESRPWPVVLHQRAEQGAVSIIRAMEYQNDEAEGRGIDAILEFWKSGLKGGTKRMRMIMFAVMLALLLCGFAQPAMAQSPPPQCECTPENPGCGVCACCTSGFWDWIACLLGEEYWSICSSPSAAVRGPTLLAKPDSRGREALKVSSCGTTVTKRPDGSMTVEFTAAAAFNLRQALEWGRKTVPNLAKPLLQEKK